MNERHHLEDYGINGKSKMDVKERGWEYRD
jgi:hypothetical protein